MGKEHERDMNQSLAPFASDAGVPRSLKLVDPESGYESFVPFTDQKSGLQALKDLLDGQLDFSDLTPILLTDIRPRKNRGNARLYIGGGYPSVSLPPKAVEAYKVYGALLMLPQEDKRFGYQWLDVFALENGERIDLSSKLTSLRINQESGRFESQGWYGPGGQAFVDYLSGKLHLENPNELPAFTIQILRSGVTYFGRCLETNIQMHMRFNKSLKTKTGEVVIQPRFDRERNYFWVEGYDVGDPEMAEPLFCRRVVWNEKGIPGITEWRKGPDMQALLDWINGKASLSRTQPVVIHIDPEAKRPHIYLGRKDLIIYLNRQATLDRTQPVFFVAREDDLYKWLEVRQARNGQLENSEIVTLIAVKSEGGKPKLRTGWFGPERQALFDYLEGKVSFGHLKAIRAQVNKLPSAQLGKCGSRELRLRTDVAFSPGETVVAKPVLNDKEDLIMEVTKEGSNEVLKHFVYDAERGNFTVFDETYYLKKTLPRVSQETGIYTDESGGEWSTIPYLIKEFGLAEASVILRLSAVRAIQGVGKNGKIASFYNLAEASQILTDYVSLPEVDEVTKEYVDADGEIWVSKTTIKMLRHGQSISAKAALKNIRVIKGRGVNKREIDLYNLTEWRDWLEKETKRKQAITPEEANIVLKELLGD